MENERRRHNSKETAHGRFVRCSSFEIIWKHAVLQTTICSPLRNHFSGGSILLARGSYEWSFVIYEIDAENTRLWKYVLLDIFKNFTG